jgi:hypothetical protein
MRATRPTKVIVKPPGFIDFLPLCYRAALGPGFPKHPLHKIVCFGALVASRQREGWRMDALGHPI